MTYDNQENNSNESMNVNEPVFDSEPQRHGCVTAWLILMLILNSLTALFYTFMSDRLTLTIPTGWLTGLIVIGIINAICAFMLLSWRKIGFYGFIVTAIIALIINLNIGISPLRASLGLIGFFVLFGVLQIKRDGVSAWANLK